MAKRERIGRKGEEVSDCYCFNGRGKFCDKSCRDEYAVLHHPSPHLSCGLLACKVCYPDKINEDVFRSIAREELRNYFRDILRSLL